MTPATRTALTQAYLLSAVAFTTAALAEEIRGRGPANDGERQVLMDADNAHDRAGVAYAQLMEHTDLTEDEHDMVEAIWTAHVSYTDVVSNWEWHNEE